MSPTREQDAGGLASRDLAANTRGDAGRWRRRRQLRVGVHVMSTAASFGACHSLVHCVAVVTNVRLAFVERYSLRVETKQRSSLIDGGTADGAGDCALYAIDDGSSLPRGSGYEPRHRARPKRRVATYRLGRELRVCDNVFVEAG
jgi:hypothetical protein